MNNLRLNIPNSNCWAESPLNLEIPRKDPGRIGLSVGGNSGYHNISFVCLVVSLTLTPGKSKEILHSCNLSMIGSLIQRNGCWQTGHQRNWYNKMEVVVSAGIDHHSSKQKALRLHGWRGPWTVVFSHHPCVRRRRPSLLLCPPLLPRLNKGRTGNEEVT